MLKELVLTDPAHVSTENLNAFDCAMLKWINDPRDLPFIRLTMSASLIVIPFAALLFIPGVFSWWLAAIYFAVNFFGFLDRYILMLHNTSHRVLFKREYRRLNVYIPWILGPFFGETPNTYYAHHMGMHHPENNLPNDLSSTMAYRRDSFFGFMHYFLRFFLLIVPELSRYMWRRRRFRLIRQMLIGEFSFYALAIMLLFVNWRATVVVFLVPFVMTRFLMMAGNWGQHAFIDQEQPGNSYRNSITCINARYNRRCFNDGYHIGHHVKANRHWTELPGDLLASRERYIQEGAIVFRHIDFFIVWLFLMLKRYDWLARFYVNLKGEPMSEAEIVELLKSRTQPFTVEKLKSFSAPVMAKGAA